MSRQEVPALLLLSGAVLATQRVRVGHITLSDRCRRPVGPEKKKKPRCLIFGTRTIGSNDSLFNSLFSRTSSRLLLVMVRVPKMRHARFLED